MKKFFRFTVLSILLVAQLLTGIHVGVLAEETPSVKSEQSSVLSNELTIEIIEDTTVVNKLTNEECLTALSLLQSIADVEIQESDYGPYIKEINGVKEEGTYYWAFYINGKKAQVGAAEYIPLEQDRISFKYESWQQEAIIEIHGNDGVITATQSINEDTTALSMLQEVAEVDLEISEYGPYIKGINSLEAVGTYYWALYVNGHSASVGAGSYSPSIGDTITFKYESWAPIEATIIIDEVTTSDTIIVELENGGTALEYLEAEMSVDMESSDWGPMVIGINKVYPDFWGFYINDGFADTGAGSYYVKDGDILKFKTESLEPTTMTTEETVGVVGLNRVLKLESEEVESLSTTMNRLQPAVNVQSTSKTVCGQPDEQLPIGNPIEKAASWVQKKGVNTFWEAVALRQAGQAISQSYFQKLVDTISENKGEFLNVTDYENRIIGLVTGDINPRNVQGYDLVKKVYNNSKMTAQGLNGVIYGLIALDSKGFDVPSTAEWTRDDFIQYILESQNKDGGWSLFGTNSDVDITAMTLSSLAKYQEEPNVETAIDNAVTWLSESQLPSGGFIANEQENSQSVAQVLIALTALGINPEGELFTKENGSVLTNLSLFQNEDGGFSNGKDEASEPIATAQGLLALVAYDRYLNDKGSVYNLTNSPALIKGETGGTGTGGSPTTPGELIKQTITISVKTHESTILSSRTIKVTEGTTALSALVDELGGRVEVNSSGYVAAIDGLAEFDHGPTSGWKYSVNGYFPTSGAGSYRLEDGDNLEWVYVTEDMDAAKSIGNTAKYNEKPKNLDEEIYNALEQISTDSQKQTRTLNKDKKMSAEVAKELAEKLKANTVKVEKLVNPTEETVISDPEIGEARIVIPKQALKQQQTLKIEEVVLNSNKSVKSAVYQFTPKGTKFDKPVYISIQMPIEDDHYDNYVMAWLDEEKNQWKAIPSVIDLKTSEVTGLVDHFTKFAIIDTTIAQTSLDISTELNQLVNYLQADQTQSEWEDFGLALLNQSNKEEVLADIEARLIEVNGSFRKITDYERYALTIQALGGNPTSIGGFDLIESIYNSERMEMQGTNGLIFALIALDSGNYQTPATAKWSREQILAKLLDNQNEDGGFTLVNGEASDVDITAMALSALANYKETPEVQEAIIKGIQWLSSVQQPSGGFVADGKENSESAAQVIIALTALGMDPEGTKFTKDNDTVVSNLLTYQNEDGGFSNVDKEESNQIASEQALLALVALERYTTNHSSIYQLTDREVEAVEAVIVSQVVPTYVDENEISAYAVESVYDAYEAGLMRGVDLKVARFAPKQPLTRAEFTTILMKLLGEESYEGDAVRFNDVKPGQWYYNVVMKAQELGIVSGVSDTDFAPNAPITREQVAVLIDRAYELEATQTTASFTDISKLNEDSREAIEAINAYGIMKGTNVQSFSPYSQVTREMAAVIAVRVDENL